MTGVVTRVLLLRGYGFARDEQGQERFMCAADFINSSQWHTITKGQRIAFTPITKPTRNGPQDNGLKAVEIEVLHA